MADPDYFSMLYPGFFDDDQDDEDGGGKQIVPDGGKVSTPMMLTDHQPGHAPWSASERAAADARYFERRARLMDAWRSPPARPVRQQQSVRMRTPQPSPLPPAVPTATDDAVARKAASDARYAARIAKLENAWRGGRS